MSAPVASTFSSPRGFELWQWRGFHSQILLRSPPTAEEDWNLDIVFYAVTFMQMEPGLRGMTLRRATAEERNHFSGKRVLYDNDALFRIESLKHEYWIVASWFSVYKNTMNLCDSPLIAFKEEDQIPNEQFGELLAED